MAKKVPAGRVRAAIYTRVSDRSQDQNTSHPTQLLSCQAHAAAAGYEVGPHYRETYSGAVLELR